MHGMLMLMLILITVMLSIIFVRYLSRAASGTMSLKNVLAMLGVVLPGFINILIPITFFLSLLININRLLYDNELMVAFACGVSWLRLLSWMLVPGLLLTLLSLLLSFWVVPVMSYYQDNINQISSKNSSTLSFLQTGRFFSTSSNGNTQIVYIGGINFKSGNSQQIFIYRQRGTNTQITLAPIGKMFQDQKNIAGFQLMNGAQYQGVIGGLSYQRLNFKNLKLLLIPNYQANNTDLSAFSTVQLLKTHNKDSILELEWRSSLPLATLILTLLGVCLGDTRPRKGKYLAFTTGILLVLLYFNGLTIARSMVINGALPLFPGLYLAHLLILVPALFMLLKLECGFNILRFNRARTSASP